MIVPTEYIAKRQAMYKGFFFNRCKNWDSAKDMFQEFFLKVYEKQQDKTFETEEQLSYWLWRVARSLFIDIVRQEKTHGMVSYDENPLITMHRNNSVEPEIEKTLELKDANEQIQKSLKKMKPEFAMTYKMHVLGEVPFRQIADSFNVSIMTALGRMRYARKHLKRDLQLT